jgi:hypothetical protein
MLNLSEDLKLKCTNLWFNSNVVAPLRFPELKNKGVFNKDEIEGLLSYFKWTDRQNCSEIIGAVALRLPANEIRCKITNKHIHFSVPFYRLYTNEEVINNCFRPKVKDLSKQKWKWDLYFDYNFEALERLCRNTTTHNIFKCPMMINHCYVWAQKQGMDTNLIANPAEAEHLWKNKFESLPLCSITNEKLLFHSGQYASYSRKGANILSKEYHTGKIIPHEVLEKTKQTNLKKYGVIAPILLAENRKKGVEVKKSNALKRKQKRDQELLLNPPLPSKEKYYKTMTERYGGPTMKFFLEKNPRTKEQIRRTTKKARETWLEKYGTINPQSLPEVRDKTKQTNKEKYGYNCYLNTPEQKKERALQDNIKTYNNFSRFADYCTPMFTLEEWLQDTKKEFSWKLKATGETYSARYWGYAPIGKFVHSSLEKHIHNILTSWNYKFIKSDRQIISPKELDVFIPSQSLAIECNGEYFHSDKKLGRTYHDKKRKECEEKNVRLLQFFGNEIETKHKAVKSVIKNTLKANDYKIFARETTIVVVEPPYARKFYEKYHVHGFCGASVHYGLLLRGKIVQMMSVGSMRFETKLNDVEIIRSATAYNFNVVGGVSKLVSAIKKDFPKHEIHTYVDLSCFTGKGYESANFEYVNTTPPSYFYFKGYRYPIYSRYQTQKHKLKKLLGNKFDQTKTEEENMKSVGYFKVYRCSHKHYVLKP